MATPFDLLLPQDGVRIREEEDAVFLDYIQHGGLQKSVPLCRREDEADEDSWRRSRMLLRPFFYGLMHSIGNGADVPRLQAVLDALFAGEAPTISIPGYRLVGSHTNSEGNIERIWCKEKTADVVRWVDDDFIDTSLTLQSLADELKSEEDDELS